LTALINPLCQFEFFTTCEGRSNRARYGVNVPPKIGDEPAKTVPVEVLPPEPALAASASSKAGGGPPIPIHALSALILAAVDSLWAIFLWEPPVWIVAIPACFLAVFLPVYLIQRHLKNDTKGRALTFATLLAVLAALPTPITGTLVGSGLLAWTGLGKLFGKSTPRS